MSEFTRRHVLATAGATVLAGGAAGALASPSAAESSSGGRARRRVVLIDIDGFDPRFLTGRYAEVHPLPRIRAGVRRGARLRHASLTDVAPTICGVLGIAPPATADGRYLREAFRR